MKGWVSMKERAVEETFRALFALTDLRQVFRDTKPTYELDEEQTRKVKEILDAVRRSLEVIEEELLGNVHPR
jgi:predicted Holliday junction resolvase-like endonuclease